MSGLSEVSEYAYCSFCGQESRQVQKIIKGPSVDICNECVDLFIAEVGGQSIRLQLARARELQAGAEAQTAYFLARQLGSDALLDRCRVLLLGFLGQASCLVNEIDQLGPCVEHEEKSCVSK